MMATTTTTAAAATNMVMPDQITYTILMRGFSSTGNIQAAAALFLQMMENKELPLHIKHLTVESILRGFVQDKKCDYALTFLDHIRQSNNHPIFITPTTATIVLHGLMQQNRIRKAQQFFHLFATQYGKPDLIMYNYCFLCVLQCI